MQGREDQHVASSPQPTGRLLQQQLTRQSSQRPGGIAPCRRVAGGGRRPEGDADRAHWCRSCKQLSCKCRAGEGGTEGERDETWRKARKQRATEGTTRRGRQAGSETARQGGTEIEGTREGGRWCKAERINTQHPVCNPLAGCCSSGTLGSLARDRGALPPVAEWLAVAGAQKATQTEHTGAGAGSSSVASAGQGEGGTGGKRDETRRKAKKQRAT